MNQQTSKTRPNTRWHVPVLTGVVVALSGVSVGLVASDGLRTAVRSAVGFTNGQPVPVPVVATMSKEQIELLAIASALGLASDAHDLSGAVKAVVNERQDLRGKYSELTTRHHSLNTQHAALNRQHGELRQAKDAYETRVKGATRKLTSNLSSGLVRTSARQVASAPGKAIPYIGIGFVAAFTALDVYEACEMMKAINEMNVELGGLADKGSHDKVCGLKVPTQGELLTQISTNWQTAYLSAAAAANQAGKAFPMTPPTIDPSQVTKQTCSIFGGLWFCR